MNNISTVTSLVRSIIQDEEKSVTDVFVSSGVSDKFTLTEANVNSIDEVLVNDIESGVTYEFTASKARVEVTSGTIVDDVVQITYDAFSQYSDTEILSYIKTALTHISLNNVNQFTVSEGMILPVPTNKEVNLISMIASVIINPANVSYRMPEISVSVPDDLPTFDKIRKICAGFKKQSGGDKSFIIRDDLDNSKNLEIV